MKLLRLFVSEMLKPGVFIAVGNSIPSFAKLALDIRNNLMETP